MAKLIVNPTSSSRREIPLTRALMSIGRDPSNDVVLPDAMVSRRHAVIEYRASQYFLRDCNSSNGSLVNGDRVSERTLRDGDLVAIGTARLLFRDEVAEEGSAKVVQHPSSARLQCPACSADHRKGDLYCRQCGASLAPPSAACPSCATVVPLPARFCNVCGTALPAPAAEASSGPRPAPAADAASDPAAPREGPSPEPPPAGTPAVEARVAAGAGGPEPGGGGGAESLGRPPGVPLSEPPAPAHVQPVEPRAAASAPGPAAARPFASASPRPASPRPLRVVPTDRVAVPARGPRAEDAAAAPAAARDEPGTFAPRALAAAADLVLVTAVQALALAPAALHWRARAPGADPAFVGVLLAVAGAAAAGIFGIAYYVYYWGIRGATPGKRLLRLAVLGEDGAEPIGATRAAVRLLGYVVSAALLGAGFVMVAFGGRGLHDRIAGTRVVRRGRG